MKHPIAILSFLLVSGCATVAAPPSPSSDGKCHGPDYNAPSCVYLF